MQQQAEDERYNYCLEALADCISKGANNSTLQTLKFEMGINDMDYRAILEAYFKLNRKAAL